MRLLLPTLALATLGAFGVGCGPTSPLGSIRTYATPVASGPPSGMVRIVPQKPFVSRTKAVFEWQVVCDREYHSFAGRNETTTVSGGTPVDRLHGGLPTVFTLFIEIETTPHGDGTMAVKISSGHRDTPSRPLFAPTAKPSPAGYGYGSNGSDGYADAPAASLVTPLLTAPTDLRLPATTMVARIENPNYGYGMVMAAEPGGKIVYRKRIAVGTKGEFPRDALSSPALRAFQRRGYQVSGMGAVAKPFEAVRLVVEP